MFRFCCVAVAGLSLALPSPGDTPGGSGSGRIRLFNGKDLDGWVAEGVTAYPAPDKKGERRPVWTVRDGHIHCAGKGFGFLRFADKKFDDFHFHVEYRMLDRGKKGNSGLGIRTVPFDPKKSTATRPSYACYEIQLLNDPGARPSAHGTGSLYRYVAPKVNVVRPAPEWNTVDVYCTGPRIRIVMNGTEILNFDQSTHAKVRDNPLSGYVCLQNHGSAIEFRDVWVRPLGKGEAGGDND